MRFKKWDKFKVHCSGIARIMSKPQKVNPPTKKDLAFLASLEKRQERTPEDLERVVAIQQKERDVADPPLSETAKSYLVERFAFERYNVRTATIGYPPKSRVMKGVGLQRDAAELLTKLDKINYETPECTVQNDFLIGRCDIMCTVHRKIVDIKASWNAPNFMANRKKGLLSREHWWQMQGYLDLYDMDFGQVAYVLLNTPEHLVQQEQAVLFKRYSFGEMERDKYDAEMERLDTIFDYSKIPETKRVIRFDVHRYDGFHNLIRNKVEKCRAWLNHFERDFILNKNIITLPSQYINADPQEDNPEPDPT
jgi:hypothetical protein